MENTRIAFFHGLESLAVSDKTEYLNARFKNVYAPSMDYKDPTLFDRVLEEVKSRKIDLLIGSSMGGYFAYCISTLTGIPTIQFNPAIAKRSMEPVASLGEAASLHIVVLGKGDDVVIPYDTVDWFKEKGKGFYSFNWETNGHRTPIDIFKKYVNSFTFQNETDGLVTIADWLKVTDL
jgi:hypothetical protein